MTRERATCYLVCARSRLFLLSFRRFEEEDDLWPYLEIEQTRGVRATVLAALWLRVNLGLSGAIGNGRVYLF